MPRSKNQSAPTEQGLNDPLINAPRWKSSAATPRSYEEPEEVPHGVIVFENAPSFLDDFQQGRCHWLQTTSALLALQLGWGLWLFPADYARLGWYTGTACLLLLAVLTTYSGMLYTRLYTFTPGAVLFGDIGEVAAGAVGRSIVYAIIYTLDATRCVILHLAAAQSLRHVFPADSMPPLWQCGLVVLLLAAVLVQIRSLAELSWVFMIGTGSQLIAIGIVVYELVMNPDPAATHTTQAVDLDSLVPAAVAFMNMIFAFGGQFAYVEVMSSMRKPQEFPRSVSICTAVMTVLYGGLGAVGYWSRGDAITGIVIFSLGDTPRSRVASALILVQATSQYLVNLNVWTHNLLVLLHRSGKPHAQSHDHADGVDATHFLADDQAEAGAEAGSGRRRAAGATGAAPDTITCSGDHCWKRWLVASLFVVAYSYGISTTVPYFSTLVGLVTSATYLICAYVLPAWFTLRLLGSRIYLLEKVVLWSLIPFSFLLSGVGLYASVMALLQDVQGGEGGWSHGRAGFGVVG
mmetsp:Transcript_35135/g.78203  ORF Transcript_35135/g.78203 Transcript_35135/m.78203 type:complete len:519 (+) Transcript_35135:215-1771(+)|eukprot:CAMPEP_0202890556 /NCGR_PEP_ID=MMETSP1392-20130828/915_1 /ASSEMBLY_ACC=CAM_ASM_000868 /TAXON_ID=225041 /ORGANISM="Chlamydomonas chlamydogama, Strain SAG 11-48b" /LENGTH=518 /DNA_ID=CAMNT_0049574147 /DNA_START=217 /DNA_END=1773 /DNA_ORIENTATION=+